MLRNLLERALQLPFHVTPAVQTSLCSPDLLSLPEIFGLNILNVSAQKVLNYTTLSLSPGSSNYELATIDFCNVSVTYEHPGWNDQIHVSVWLPLEDWNGRLQALGGGGYSATFGPLYLTQAVAAGYVAIATDAGLGGGIEIAHDPSSWALSSPGNVNLYNLENFGSRSLEDMTHIGKLTTRIYYGVAPSYAYFSGCSGGGRQGLMIAQAFPDLYDGILAIAPAINIESFVPAGYWATQVMNDLGYYPPPCEVEAFTREAIAACDDQDGLEDGIIGSPELCNFTAHEAIGKSFVCSDTTLQLTSEGAIIVQAAWDGPRSSSGEIGWFGLAKDASLSAGYVQTRCLDNNTSRCTAGSASLTSGFIRYFLAKDPAWSASAMTKDDFFEYLRYSKQAYASTLSTSLPDLLPFKAAGGKMITWHGGADEVIPLEGSTSYYQQVMSRDVNTSDCYRLFVAPGVGHCIGGAGYIPNGAFGALVRWVEEGVVPDTLSAVSQNADGTTRSLCAYPARQRYSGGNVSNPTFECVDAATVPGDGLRVQYPLFNHSQD